LQSYHSNFFEIGITTHNERDASQVQSLLEEIDAPIDTFNGDAGGYAHQGT